MGASSIPQKALPCLLKRAEFAIHLQQFEQAFQYLNDALRLNDQLHEAYWMKGKDLRYDWC